MKSSRRSFLKSLAGAAAALPVLGRIPFAHAEDLPLCKESDEQPKTLKFVAKADKAPKGSPRKDKDKAQQYCYNCQLFQRQAGEGKKGEGKCMIMTKCRVSAESWCMSWVQNPAIKG